MERSHSRRLLLTLVAGLLISSHALAQREPVRNWAAPLYWQPSEQEASIIRHAREMQPMAGTSAAQPMADPSVPLVLVAMTPCRGGDTRAGQGFSGSFGQPRLAGGVARTFPIQSNTTCPILSTAQAYSFNVTVVPPGPLGYLTVYPTGQPLPLAATLNSLQGYVVGNAAIVAAGTSGSIDVFASNATDLVIDINGYYASLTDLLGNTALGTGALALNTTGSDNTASGLGALSANTSGSDNTASGYQALQKNNGDNNTANGFGALNNNAAGSSNTASGAYALNYNTTGGQNTASGALALESNISGVSNTASGYQALQSNTGSFNTASGGAALRNNISGTENTASGYEALYNNTFGGNNTANGYQALQGPTTGSTGGSNTASGSQALQSNNTGGGNTASGAQALQSNNTGSDNTASGLQALQSNDGTGNTASGFQAMQSNTAGGGNTASGYKALLNNLTRCCNTAIGYQALLNSTGQNNIALGESAGDLLTDGSYNIMIGNPGQSDDLSTIRMGDTDQARTFTPGLPRVKTGSSDAIPVLIDSYGQLGTVSSSRRFKEDIQDMGDSSGGLLRLRPVTFRYRQPFADGSKPMEYGLIAEEVAEVYPDLVAHSADGQIESVKYQVLDSMLLNELQKQNRELQAQKQHAQKQDETIRQQQEQNRKLEARLAALEALLPGKVPAAANAGQ